MAGVDASTSRMGVFSSQKDGGYIKSREKAVYMYRITSGLRSAFLTGRPFIGAILILTPVLVHHKCLQLKNNVVQQRTLCC